MVLCSNKLQESERVCSGICTQLSPEIVENRRGTKISHRWLCVLASHNLKITKFYVLTALQFPLLMKTIISTNNVIFYITYNKSEDFILH